MKVYVDELILEGNPTEIHILLRKLEEDKERKLEEKEEQKRKIEEYIETLKLEIGKCIYNEIFTPPYKVIDVWTSPSVPSPFDIYSTGTGTGNFKYQPSFTTSKF